MQAEVRDEITVRGRNQGDDERHGEIIEVHGQDGSPPYLVRWRDGSESVFSPSSDVLIQHDPGGPASR